MTQDHDDFAFEPVRGLPAHLPEGERILWQGAPDTDKLVVSAFHVRKVGLYFAVVAMWQLAIGFPPGASFQKTIATMLPMIVAALASIAILYLLAWLYARSTVYTLTTKRIVIRSGLALPVTFNLPLNLIENALVRRLSGTAGSISLEVAKPNRVAFLVLWPNARPWHFSNPQPTLRALGDVDALIPVLRSALKGAPGTMPARAATLTHRPESVIPEAGVAA